MVCLSKVYFREDTGTLQPGSKIVDVGYRISIRNCGSVQFPVIDAYPELLAARFSALGVEVKRKGCPRVL